MSDYLSTADEAKLIRKVLKEKFPGFKFSVRSKNYSMDSSIHIDWENGPTEDNVEKYLTVFGSVSYDNCGDILSGGNRYIFCNRHFSHQMEERVLNELKKTYANFDDFSLIDYRNGRIYDLDTLRLFRRKLDETDLYCRKD